MLKDIRTLLNARDILLAVSPCSIEELKENIVRSCAQALSSGMNKTEFMVAIDSVFQDIKSVRIAPRKLITMKCSDALDDSHQGTRGQRVLWDVQNPYIVVWTK